MRDCVQALQGLPDDQVLQEMAYEFYSVQTITRLKFERVQRATWSAVGALMVWELLMVLLIFL